MRDQGVRAGVLARGVWLGAVELGLTGESWWEGMKRIGSYTERQGKEGMRACVCVGKRGEVSMLRMCWEKEEAGWLTLMVGEVENIQGNQVRPRRRLEVGFCEV